MNSPLQLHQFGLLRVKAVQPIGAFLAWRPGEDLFLPLREQTEPVEAEQAVIVRVAEDMGGRPIASMQLGEFLDPEPGELRPLQRVGLLVYAESPLGYQAIINHRHSGLIYHSEAYQALDYGTSVVGYVKQIRPDGKIDLMLQAPGVQGTPDLGRLILERLRERGGFLPLTDRSPPELIYQLFGASKKKFKIALGALYKQHKVRLEPEGIRIVRTDPGEIGLQGGQSRQNF